MALRCSELCFSYHSTCIFFNAFQLNTLWFIIISIKKHKNVVEGFFLILFKKLLFRKMFVILRKFKYLSMHAFTFLKIFFKMNSLQVIKCSSLKAINLAN